MLFGCVYYRCCECGQLGSVGGFVAFGCLCFGYCDLASSTTTRLWVALLPAGCIFDHSFRAVSSSQSTLILAAAKQCGYCLSVSCISLIGTYFPHLQRICHHTVVSVSAAALPVGGGVSVSNSVCVFFCVVCLVGHDNTTLPSVSGYF